jgi:6-pyruvoyltetrahydropterin/6-carboxytetrahydropterin synthase
MNIRITKEFKFEMAHALLGYDGPCKNIHGHSYKLAVTLKGSPNEDTKNAKLGMVMDFGDLKKIIAAEIIEKYDHALLLNKRDIRAAALTDQKIVAVDFQPTCENMIIHFLKLIEPRLPAYVTLNHILLKETDTSYAEWYAEDN